MIIQISAGQGKPVECQFAVGKIFEKLQKEYHDIKIVSEKIGWKSNCYESIRFQTQNDLSFLEGSIQWICKSPFRTKHKRKNWFIDVSIIPQKENISTDKDFRVEKFHCGGKGGQNVNKVESGVRIIHIPTGIVATSTEERSQYMNKQRAMGKIQEILKSMTEEAEAKQNHHAWKEHNHIIRGNPVRVYSGIKFERIK